MEEFTDEIDSIFLASLGVLAVWGRIVIAVTVIALSVYARRRGNQRMEAAFKRVFDRELERLESDQLAI